MSFTPFIKPYPDGYEDFEVGGTPVTAEILNTNYDGFLLALNEFLPELEGMVEANPSEAATAGNLTKLKVGNSIYLIPSGGSGGSTVEWEQLQITGTKIATITIDNVPVDVYAPSGGGSGDEVSWNQVLGSGTEIGTIIINDTPITVYAPTPIDVEANPSGSATAGDLTKLKVGSSIYSIPSGGSGGASDLSDLDDVSITNVQNGQIIKWNSTTSKWENSNESGGTGGHTIIDENGNSMSARAGLQFVGGANVSDDSTNNKTIVDLASAGGIDGVFIDTDNLIDTEGTDSSGSMSYTATEDCFAVIRAFLKDTSTAITIKVDGVLIFGNRVNSVSVTSSFIMSSILLKKGQVLTVEGCYVTNDNFIKVYGIQTGTTHSKFQPIIYSTEEREIGVWIDGKPLYQKSVLLSQYNVSLSDNVWTNIFAVTDWETIVAAEVNTQTPNTKHNLRFQLLSGYVQGASKENINLSSYNNLYVTYCYTKSTDVAGSGSWTPQGVPTHHYSTDEHIVGTWIDGKTLYEKTFDYSSNPILLTPNTWLDSGIPSSLNIDKLVGHILRTESGVYPLVEVTKGASNYTVGIRNDASINNRNMYYLTIQYTKSS